MAGQACIRGMRIPVSLIVNLADYCLQFGVRFCETVNFMAAAIAQILSTPTF